MIKGKAFVIHSLDTDEGAAVTYAMGLEEDGWVVYVPARDTDQSLPPCERFNENFKAIQNADHVFLMWDGKSHGALVDLGYALALGKRVFVTDIKGAQTRWGEYLKEIQGKWLVPEENEYGWNEVGVFDYA